MQESCEQLVETITYEQNFDEVKKTLKQIMVHMSKAYWRLKIGKE